VPARLRPELADLPAYTPGKTVAGAIKIASNETVHGPLPSVRAAIEKSTDTINRYPDNGYVELKERLAKHVNFAPEHIAAGCGSVSLCQQLIQITSTVGDEVLYGWRSFEIYPLQTRTAGATPVQVPLTDHIYDLDAMAAAVTDRTRLIFVCNPNNPTSTVVDPDALARFVEAVPSDILIALDEAYVEYITDDMLPDSFGLVRAHSNVVVLRTFSKAYGLAGLRVGYAVGDPDIITALGKVYVPFSATSVSQAAAIASLDAADELLVRTVTRTPSSPPRRRTTCSSSSPRVGSAGHDHRSCAVRRTVAVRRDSVRRARGILVNARTGLDRLHDRRMDGR
jgi:histidinol-phosphate aminotransferase